MSKHRDIPHHQQRTRPLPQLVHSSTTPGLATCISHQLRAGYQSITNYQQQDRLFSFLMTSQPALTPNERDGKMKRKPFMIHKVLLSPVPPSSQTLPRPLMHFLFFFKPRFVNHVGWKENHSVPIVLLPESTPIARNPEHRQWHPTRHPPQPPHPSLGPPTSPRIDAMPARS